MNTVDPLTFQRYNYAAVTPGVDPSMRGGESNLRVAGADAGRIVEVANDIGGLLQGSLDGWAVFHQNDARSKQGESVRDVLVDLAGQAAGFDVDGTLSTNEQQARVTIADNDIEALGIDKPAAGDLTIDATFRSIQFGSIATKSDWQITEVEFENRAIEIGHDAVTIDSRHNRILSLTPLTQ